MKTKSVRISSRDRRLPEYIRDRKPFTTHGAMRAEVVDGLTGWNSGQLHGADRDRFREECLSIRYVVYSYVTPIAWWTKERGWHVVSQRFSRTTSTHQGRLYLIPDGATASTQEG